MRRKASAFILASLVLLLLVDSPISSQASHVHIDLPLPADVLGYRYRLSLPEASVDGGGKVKAIVEFTDLSKLPEMSARGWNVTYVSRLLPVAFLEVPEGDLEEVRRLPYVRSVWPDRKVSLADMDLLGFKFKVEGYRPTLLEESTRMIGAQSLWSMGFTGRGVKIAIVDTGVNSSHPDLMFPDGRSKIVESRSFVEGETAEDRHGHGTAIAGIAAGSGLASGGLLKGVAPDALIVNVKAFKSEGLEAYSTLEILFKALEYVEEVRPDVVCAAWGVYPPLPEDHPFDKLIQRLVEEGIIFVAAAGNLGYCWTVASPGSTLGVISVGAASRYGVAFFSSGGPDPYSLRGEPMVVAPGVKIVAPGSGAMYRKFKSNDYPGYLEISGTSPAAAHVAGLTALLLSAMPGLTPQALLAGLVASAQPFEDVDYVLQGGGLVDGYRCLKLFESSLTASTVKIPVEFRTGLRALSLEAKPEAKPTGRAYSRGFENYTLIGNGLLHLVASERGEITWLFYGTIRQVDLLTFSILPYGSERWVSPEDFNLTSKFKVTEDTGLVQEGYSELEYGGLGVQASLRVRYGSPYLELTLSFIGEKPRLVNFTLKPSVHLGFTEAAYLGGLEGFVVWSRWSIMGLASETLPYEYRIGYPTVLDEPYAPNPENVTLTFKPEEEDLKIYLVFSNSYKGLADVLLNLTGRTAVETAVKPLESVRVQPPSSGSTVKLGLRNLGLARSAELTLEILDGESRPIYVRSYSVRLEGFTDTYYEFELPRLNEGLYTVSFTLTGAQSSEGSSTSAYRDLHRSDDRFTFKLYVGLHPEVYAILPSRINGLERPFVLRYPGDVDYFNVTLISSRFLPMVRAEFKGTVDKIARIYSVRNTGFQVYVSVYVEIPVDAAPSFYNGSLVFSSPNRTIASIPVELQVEKPSHVVLWHDRLDFIPGRHDLYLWYTELWKRAASEGVRIVPVSLHINPPRRVDFLVLPDPFYGYQDLEEVLKGFLELGGSGAILVGSAIFALKYGYNRILEEYGLKALKEPYRRWANTSEPIDLTGLKDLAPLNLTLPYAVAFNVSNPRMDGYLQTVFRSREVGPYGFLNVSSEFNSVFLYRDRWGTPKIFVHSSIFGFDDFWCRFAFKVDWSVEEGVPVGYLDPIENGTPGNLDLLIYVFNSMSNAPPKITFLETPDVRVEQGFESYTVVASLYDQEGSLEDLNVSLEVLKPDGSKIYVEGVLKGDVYIARYTASLTDPVGSYTARFRVEDRLGAYVERTLEFEVIPPAKTLTALILLVGLPCILVGYGYGRRRVKVHRGTRFS